MSKEMILIVDDDPNDVDLIKYAFKKLGNDNPVHVCADGDCGLAYLDGKGNYADREKFPLPFIMILDWKLSSISGLDVLKNIRGRQGLAKLCVAVLSGSEYAHDRETALKAGADLFLQKPVGAFEDVIKTILEFAKQCESPE